MKMALGDYFKANDLPTFFNFNHVDRRDKIVMEKPSTESEIEAFKVGTWK